MHSTDTIEIESSSLTSLPCRGTPGYQLVKDRAERELEWHFAKPQGKDASREPSATTIVERLAALPAFHRGALALRHDAREWPASLQSVLGRYTAMAVRLHCSDHPAIGSRETLEKAAAERLDEIARVEGVNAEALIDLEERAERFYEKSLRAYMRMRETEARVAPSTPQRRPHRAPATAA
jgi:hypothetical protein